ncbi:hypothetical protein BGZ65_007571 [Modicella reniformis]|uniref:Carboxylic ester hydrolase n=1 Tax=Modicella reniformis TaxID=1440133 RepID=A0A9P6MB91_9FUNG|nr:hypothetical protein BGZ65_007571 [Modicella reniformis]
MIDTHYCREPQLVMIEGYGVLQGLMDSSRLLTKYLNIPFATVQDPGKHAVAPESWKGIRDSTVLGPMCPQKVQDSNNLTTLMAGLPGPGFTFSERDCLNLNVFAPRCVEHVPVICYIHGGLSHGGNALPKNDATNIVKQSIAKETPVVVVTINYRLLPSAGLLESSKERAMQGEDDEANEKVDWGVYDQKIALEWIRKHIHNFGGNPHEITLMGHSSGESSAGYHLMTARDESLFKRAIMHSESKKADKATERVPEGRAREQRNESDMDVGTQPTRVTLETCVTTPSQLKPQIHGDTVEYDSEESGVPFTFMSDACMPYMTESEKQAGVRVIDWWIDFAYGNIDAEVAWPHSSQQRIYP